MASNYRPGKRAYDYGDYRVEQDPLTRPFGPVPSNAVDEWKSFEGKGPKGWKRSDDRIRELVCENLSEDSLVDASDIEVTVTEGVVKLTGSVNGRASKREAEWCADQVHGVVDVQNELTIKSAADRVQTSYGGPLNPGPLKNERADDMR